MEFFLEGVVYQARDTATRVKQIQDLQHAWPSLLHEHKESASTLRLADYLFENPIITVPQAQEILGMTYRGALRVITTLVNHAILVPLDDRKYGKAYVAKDVLLGIFGSGSRR